MKWYIIATILVFLFDVVILKQTPQKDSGYILGIALSGVLFLWGIIVLWRMLHGN
jgi:hypothetical protein